VVADGKQYPMSTDLGGESFTMREVPLPADYVATPEDVPQVRAVVTFNILREISKKRPGRAFASSCAALVLHLLLFGAAVYPTLVFSTPNHAYDLNIYNSASTLKTLGFMFVVAIVGVPIVLTYTITVY